MVAVAAATLTVYLAHAIGERVGRDASAAVLHLRAELRDAVPILTAGSIPVLVLALGTLGLLPAPVAVLVAAGAVLLTHCPDRRQSTTGSPCDRIVTWNPWNGGDDRRASAEPTLVRF